MHCPGGGGIAEEPDAGRFSPPCTLGVDSDEKRLVWPQDDFRNLIRNPLLGDLPPVTPKLQSVKTLAGEDDVPEDLKPCRNPNNPICFFDIEIGGKPGSNETGQSVGRIYFELHAHIVPKVLRPAARAPGS